MLSRISYIVCAGVLFYLCFVFHPKWNHKGGEAPIGWDVATYYWYVPSALIYHDLKYQNFEDSISAKYRPMDNNKPYSVQDNGGKVFTYSCGMAFMYLPQFIVAHVAAKLMGYPTDGFSLPYQFAMQVGGLLFALLGLWYYRKLLLLYFEDKVVAILLAALVLGTAYINYAAFDGGMTHCWLLGIYALLLLNTHRFYNNPSYKYAIGIGITCGLAILIRPSEIICILLPLLWGMESISKKAIQAKISFLKLHLKHLITVGICIVLIGSIQLLYWKYVSGHWVVYSYGDDKTFSWLHPHIIDYTLSYKSGWLVYCPIMLLAVIGFYFLIKNGKNKVAIVCFSLLNLYIISSWDIWWYAGIPARAMIQGYAVLLFPFGYALQAMMKKRIVMVIVYPFMLIAAYLNIWMVINAHKENGLFDSDNMTEAYYWHVIGRWHVNPDVIKLKDTDELFEGTPKNMTLIYQNDFENDTDIVHKYTIINGRVSDYVENGKEQSKHLTFAVAARQATWIRVQAVFRGENKEWDVWRMPRLSVNFINENGEIVKDRALTIHRFINEYEPKELYLDVKIPEQPFAKVDVFIQNRGSDKPLSYDDVKVWSFNE